MKLLEKIIDDIRDGQNIENYIIIILAIVILALDIFGISNNEAMSEITLAVLALIAFGRIMDARRLENMEEQVSLLGQSRFLQKYPDSLKNDMHATSELWMVGITLDRTVQNNYPDFLRQLNRGATIKVLLIKPGSNASTAAAFRELQPRQASYLDQKIKHTMSEFCRMKAESSNGNLELKTIDVVPSFGCYAMNPEQKDGKIYVEHYGFKSEEDVPRLVLTSLDGFVYDSFLNQLHNLWENASEWECK